jgi:hypothetical protein
MLSPNSFWVILVIGPDSELNVVTILASYGVNLDDIYVLKGLDYYAIIFMYFVSKDLVVSITCYLKLNLLEQDNH